MASMMPAPKLIDDAASAGLMKNGKTGARQQGMALMIEQAIQCRGSDACQS